MTCRIHYGLRGRRTIAGSTPEDAIVMLTQLILPARNAAEALGRTPQGPVIRLRDQPDAPAGSPTIYRYDRERLVAALAEAAATATTGEAA